MTLGASGDPIQCCAEFIRMSDHQIMASIDDLGGPIGLAFVRVVMRLKEWVRLGPRQDVVLARNALPSLTQFRRVMHRLEGMRRATSP